MHDLSFEDLRVVVVATRAGSFTAAAAAAGYSQPAISRRIAGIEATVGHPLFVRGTRGIALTPVGHRFVGHAKALLRSAAEAECDLAGDEAEPEVRLGTFTTANASLVPNAVAAVLRGTTHRVTVREGLTATLLDRIRRGALDLAVVSDYPEGSLDAEGLAVAHLLDDPLLVALSASHPLADLRGLRLTHLRDEAWIDASRSRDTVLTNAALRAGFRPTISHSVREWTAKLGFVSAGLGITIVPGLLALPPRPDIVLRSVGDDLPSRRVFLASLAGVQETPAAQAMRDVLVAQASGRPNAGRGTRRRTAVA